MAKKKRLSERKRLAAIFVSFTILLVGAISLSENMSIDYYSVMDTVQKIIPASIVMGALGWIMGMVLDKPQGSRKINSNLFLDQMMKNDLTQSQESEENNDIDKEE